MPFTFTQLSIPDVRLIEARRFKDARGSFLESYQHAAFAAAGITDRFVQDNISYSRRHVLRGLHYQLAPASQGKLVYAARGTIFDVVVDIRRGSPTYGQWVGATLDADNGPQLLFVPAGFAHGFCVLSDEACVSYKTTADYTPKLERGIRWNDPAIKIVWPIAAPILNDRDASLPTLADAENNFAITPAV